MKINIPVLYNQMDSRWGNVLLGFNTQAQYNIYNYGCLITCEAMVVSYYGQINTPVNINDKLKSIKGYTNGSGNYIYGSLSKIFPFVKEIRTQTPAALTDAQINQIKSSIDKGYPVMVQLDYNPKTVENDMHFVLVVGYNPSDENDFTIADPIGGKLKSLKDYLGWFKPSARKTIEQYIIFEGPVPSNKLTLEELLKTEVPTKNFEGNIRTVGFYFNEWEVEKKDRLKLINDFADEKHKLEDKLETLRIDNEEKNLQITKLIAATQNEPAISLLKKLKQAMDEGRWE